jgi:hypothetical protein
VNPPPPSPVPSLCLVPNTLLRSYSQTLCFRVQVWHLSWPYLILLAWGHVDVIGVLRPMMVVIQVVVIHVLVPVLLLLLLNHLWPLFSRVFRVSWWMMGGMTSLLHVLCGLFVNSPPHAYESPCAPLLVPSDCKTEYHFHFPSVAAKVSQCSRCHKHGVSAPGVGGRRSVLRRVQSVPRAPAYWSLFC